MHSLQRLLLLQCCGHEHSSNLGLLLCSAALALCEADHSLAFVFSFAERLPTMSCRLLEAAVHHACTRRVC
jgi:hypothetical protein